MPRARSKPAQDMSQMVDTEALARGSASRDDLARIEQQITTDQLRFSEQIGMFRGCGLSRKFLDLIQIELLAEWRDSKNYKGLRIAQADGIWITIQNFADLCRAAGVAYETANEWISNYQALGEDFLRDADAAGIGVRDLRRLRKLPESEIEAARQLLQSDGKEAVIEFVADLCAKHDKDRAKLAKQVDGLQADAEAHAKLLEKKDQKLNELHKRLHQRDRTKDWHPRAGEIAIEIAAVGGAVLSGCNRLDELRDVILTEDFGEDRDAAIEAMAVIYYDLVWQLLDVANDLGHACHQVFQGYKEKVRSGEDMLAVFGPRPDAADGEQR